MDREVEASTCGPREESRQPREGGDERRPLAEIILLPERLIVAPVAGVFRPAPPDASIDAGEAVRMGQVIGTIERRSETVDVVSAHAGVFMGMLVARGERVRAHQPVAWLRVTG